MRNQATHPYMFEPGWEQLAVSYRHENLRDMDVISKSHDLTPPDCHPIGWNILAMAPFVQPGVRSQVF